MRNKYILESRLAITHLVHLDIPMGPVATSRVWPEGRGETDFDMDLRPYKIANLVRTIPFLEVLALRNQRPYTERVRIWPVLAAICPGHLESIYLECCLHRKDVLAKFFSDHRKTLESWCMDRTFLLDFSAAWMSSEMRNELDLKICSLTSFLIEIKTSHTVYWDSPEHQLDDPQRDAAPQMISSYVTHQTDVLPVDIAEETTDHKNPGVIEFIGRHDYPETFSYEDAAWMDNHCPDHLHIPFEDDEERDNRLIDRLEVHNQVLDREFCQGFFPPYPVTPLPGINELQDSLDQLSERLDDDCFTVPDIKQMRMNGWLL